MTLCVRKFQLSTITHIRDSDDLMRHFTQLVTGSTFWMNAFVCSNYFMTLKCAISQVCYWWFWWRQFSSQCWSVWPSTWNMDDGHSNEPCKRIFSCCSVGQCCLCNWRMGRQWQHCWQGEYSSCLGLFSSSCVSYQCIFFNMGFPTSIFHRFRVFRVMLVWSCLWCIFYLSSPTFQFICKRFEAPEKPLRKFYLGHAGLAL